MDEKVLIPTYQKPDMIVVNVDLDKILASSVTGLGNEGVEYEEWDW